MNIPTIRAKIKTKTTYQPALAPILNLLDRQLRNFARGNPEDQDHGREWDNRNG